MSEIIGVIYGGYSNEREVSLKSGEAIFNSLIKSGYKAVLIDLKRPDDLGNWSFLKQLIDNRVESVIIAIHGTPGEDGILQGFLELSGIRYSGSSLIAAALSMDKSLAKLIFQKRGIPTPEFVTVERGYVSDSFYWKRYPAVIKPACEGSSVGVIFVDDSKKLEQAVDEMLLIYDKIIIEEMIAGDEITVGFMNDRPLPIIKIVPKSGFYDYKNKYTKDATEYIVPAPLEKSVAENVSKEAARAVKAMGVSGISRVDIILRHNKPYILEVNSIPGMTETSLLPKAADSAGYDFDSLCRWIAEDASKKPNSTHKTC